jgi:hypothetical protein
LRACVHGCVRVCAVACARDGCVRVCVCGCVHTCARSWLPACARPSNSQNYTETQRDAYYDIFICTAHSLQFPPYDTILIFYCTLTAVLTVRYPMLKLKNKTKTKKFKLLFCTQGSYSILLVLCFLCAKLFLDTTSPASMACGFRYLPCMYSFDTKFRHFFCVRTHGTVPRLQQLCATFLFQPSTVAYSLYDMFLYTMSLFPYGTRPPFITISENYVFILSLENIGFTLHTLIRHVSVHNVPHL